MEESAEVACPSLDGCKTNAITIEEPRSIVMTMREKDMVDEQRSQSTEETSLIQAGGKQRQ